MYGLTQVNIDNSNCVYTSSFKNRNNYVDNEQKTPETNVNENNNKPDYSESDRPWGMTEEEFKRAIEEAFEGQGHDHYGGWN